MLKRKRLNKAQKQKIENISDDSIQFFYEITKGSPGIAISLFDHNIIDLFDRTINFLFDNPNHCEKSWLKWEIINASINHYNNMNEMVDLQKKIEDTGNLIDNARRAGL